METKIDLRVPIPKSTLEIPQIKPKDRQEGIGQIQRMGEKLFTPLCLTEQYWMWQTCSQLMAFCQRHHSHVPYNNNI